MRFIAVEDLGDDLTFVGRKRRDVDERFYALLIGSCNHCPGIGVSRYNYRTFCPGDRPVQRDDVVTERGERKRRGNDLQSFLVEKEDDCLPTRSIRPSAMFTVGMGRPLDVFFAISSMLIAIPTGVKVLNWTATMIGGRIRFQVPMLFCIAFLVQFLLAGITGISHAGFWQLA